MSERRRERHEWADCQKFLPYRDFQGRLVLFPGHSQRRRTYRGGLFVWEYRERAETEDEKVDRMAW